MNDVNVYYREVAESEAFPVVFVQKLPQTEKAPLIVHDEERMCGNTWVAIDIIDLHQRASLLHAKLTRFLIQK